MICVLNNRKIRDYSDLLAVYNRLWNSSLFMAVWLWEQYFLNLGLDSKLFMYEIWQRDIFSGKCYNSIGAWNITNHIVSRVRL